MILSLPYLAMMALSLSARGAAAQATDSDYAVLPELGPGWIVAEGENLCLNTRAQLDEDADTCARLSADGHGGITRGSSGEWLTAIDHGGQFVLIYDPEQVDRIAWMYNQTRTVSFYLGAARFCFRPWLHSIARGNWYVAGPICRLTRNRISKRRLPKVATTTTCA
jgi:hypothetical protein